ncbi:MAG: GAF domain-containing protein [Nitriliruptoraceae bacterium]|nr:GAF domain-containing protein [Nitriliruptoraceae bacterium]
MTSEHEETRTDRRALDALGQHVNGRHEVLAAVAYAAERFLRGGGFARTVDDVLAALGTATGVDRSYVFTVESESSTWWSTHRYEWVASGVEPQLDMEMFQGFDMVAGGFRRWTELLPRGITISAPVVDLPSDEATVLGDLDIGAIAVAPIQVRGRWWGWIAFETLDSRHWTRMEIDALEAAAAVIGACVQQEESNELLRRNEERATEAFHRERVAVERLRALDRLKDTFLTAVSHELRTPLTAISGFTETLDARLTELSDEQIHDLLARIRSNGQRLESLLGELLDLNRLRERAFEVDPQLVDLEALVQDVLEDAAVGLGPRRCTLRVAAPLAQVQTDPVLLRRVLGNLLENAGRHTPPDTNVEVAVRTEDDIVLLVVSDDGPGIPADWRRRVFEPFQHGPNVRPDQPGTGIGLSLVSRFVALLGGRIELSEPANRGARFTVRIPCSGPPVGAGTTGSEAGTEVGRGVYRPHAEPS